MLIYNDKNKELSVTEDNEYIYNIYDDYLLNVFKKVSLVQESDKENYDIKIIEDMEQYIIDNTPEEEV